MEQMTESGYNVFRDGLFIDLYNQRVWKDVAICIMTRIFSANHYWVTRVYEK